MKHFRVSQGIKTNIIRNGFAYGRIYRYQSIGKNMRTGTNWLHGIPSIT